MRVSTSLSSTVKAGGKVTIAATGGGQDSNVLIQGSDVTAGTDVNLYADNKVTLRAAENTASQRSSNTSSSGSVGISFGTDGFLVTGSASRGKGHADGDDTWYSNTHVTAGKTLNIHSGGDTILDGAVASGQKVKADIGGNLLIGSRQDTSSYTSSQQNIGGSVAVGFGNSSASVSASHSRANSQYSSVGEQSGIKAGDGGFDVNVKGKTVLTGGVIASTDAAVNTGLNHFESKGGLELHDLQNTADYKATSVGVSVSTGGSAQSAGLTGTGIGLGYDKGHASSTTTSGISGIAGNTAVRSGDGPTGISKIFNADVVEKDVNAQQQLTQTFTRDAPKAVAGYADRQGKDLQKQSDEESDPTRKAELREEAAQWGEGGVKRVALHTATGALSGGIAGALGAGASAASAPALNTLQDNVEQGLVNAGMNPSLAHGVAQGVTTVAAVGAGAAFGGAQGGAAAGMVDANNRALHPAEKQVISTLARNKATQDCQGNTQCERSAQTYWSDLMEKAALGLVDDEAQAKNMQYLAQLAQTANQPGSEGAGGAVEKYLNDYKTAQNMLAPKMGQTITMNGQPTVSYGTAQTYFSATEQQRSDPTVNVGFFNPQGSIVPNIDARDAERLDHFKAQNGSAQPVYLVEDILLGGAIGAKAVSAAGKALSELDVLVAGTTTPTKAGTVNAGNISSEGLPVKLTPAERSILQSIDGQSNVQVQGTLREIAADNYFTRNGYTALEGKCGSGNCFDGVYVKGDKIYINEVKPLNADGTIKLSGPSGNMPTQMTDEWIQSAAIRLKNGNPSQQATAEKILTALKANENGIVKIVTGVNVNGITIVKIK